MLGAATFSIAASAAAQVPFPKNYSDQDRGYAIVVLKGAPLSTAAATKPISGRKIDFQSSAVQAQRAQLATERTAYRRWLHANVPAARVTNEFDIALNAVSVQLNGAALAQVAGMASVTQVTYQSLFHKIASDPAATLKPAMVRATQAVPQNSVLTRAGAGVKVAVIDSGIDISHPCFADTGYPAHRRAGDSRFVNNKVIAAKAFTGGGSSSQQTPAPTDSHGTHVSGTIACNAASGSKMFGIAPRALLGNYNVFPGMVTTARSEDILNAMEAAYRDGFDIVNFSLGGGQGSGSGIEIRALRNLDQANMLFAGASGKAGGADVATDGPVAAGVDYSAGAALQEAVVADNENEKIVPLAVIRSSGAEYLAARASFGVVPVGGLIGPLAPVLDPRADVAVTGGLGRACSPIRRFSLTGSIALVMRGACDFTTKLRNVEAAGAIAAIVVAEEGEALIVMGANDDVMQPTIPAFMVNPSDRSSLQANSGIATMLPRNPVEALAEAHSEMFKGLIGLTPGVVNARLESAPSAPSAPAWAAAEVRSAMTTAMLIMVSRNAQEGLVVEPGLTRASSAPAAETFAELSRNMVNR